MLRQIKVADLCNELEEKLVDLQYSEDSMRRYRKVFQEFKEYAGDCDYSQSKGTDFLLWKFKQLGGFVTSGEHALPLSSGIQTGNRGRRNSVLS